MRRSSSAGSGAGDLGGSGASVMSTVYFDASEDLLPGSPVSIGALKGLVGLDIWHERSGKRSLAPCSSEVAECQGPLTMMKGQVLP